MQTFNTKNFNYIIHCTAAYALSKLWNIQLIEITTDYGHLLFYRGD